MFSGGPGNHENFFYFILKNNFFIVGMKYCKRLIACDDAIILRALKKTSEMHNAKEEAFNELNKQKNKTD